MDTLPLHRCFVEADNEYNGQDSYDKGHARVACAARPTTIARREVEIAGSRFTFVGRGIDDRARSGGRAGANT